MKVSDALIVALVTVIINFFIQLFFKYKDNRSQQLSIQLAIIAEIKALKKLIEQRKYVQDIQNVVLHLEKNRGYRITLSLDIQENVFPVYSSNLDKIGQLSPKIAPQVVTFYALLSSILQDVKVGGLLSIREQGNYQNYKNIYDLLTNALEIADEIISSRHNSV
ncbi:MULTISPECIES: hypothetical protein [Acinetobacter calcoaceticus/baumannii complex]|nr:MULTISPECIES: hypothetical protein [Acinetobacter calcoaceticus/baumannii complex]KCY48793.1 hypothetical protein J715_2439 [Acinetobacter baumannii 1571545]AIL74681.1 hypothetical protein IX88_05680 [Acinetobacter baumannii]AJB49278.1 hypothetical protein RR32_14565 [Acinetobacter nosocomialis]ELA9167640.1 hypothetical protein [Acinetobacter baumannii]EXE77632.1 hypothetical protein J582_1683 [Acinetobacter sp. 1566109]